MLFRSTGIVSGLGLFIPVIHRPDPIGRSLIDQIEILNRSPQRPEPCDTRPERGSITTIARKTTTAESITTTMAREVTALVSSEQPL